MNEMGNKDIGVEFLNLDIGNNFYKEVEISCGKRKVKYTTEELSKIGRNLFNTNDKQTVKFIKINDNAKLPYKASNSAACSDLYSVEDVVILPGKTVMVSTGLKVAHIPNGFRLDLYDRSGFRAKGIFGSSVGIIDEDYRGELKVILFNSTDKDFIVKIGDRIAQAALTPVQQVSYEFTETFEDTERSEGGFGSTGKN